MEKKLAHRQAIGKKRKRAQVKKGEPSQTDSHSDYMYELFPMGADMGDTTKCRICGTPFTNRAHRLTCDGCEGVVCRKCSLLKPLDFNSVKRKESVWICHACDSYLVNDN